MFRCLVMMLAAAFCAACAPDSRTDDSDECGLTSFASGPASNSLTVNGNALFWVVEGTWLPGFDGSVFGRLLCGGATQMLVQGQNKPAEMVLDVSHFYWTSRDPDFRGAKLYRAPRAGGGAALIAEYADPTAAVIPVATDESAIYYAENLLGAWRVMKRPKTSAISEPLADAASTIWTIAVDATHVYWEAGDLFRIEKGGGQPIPFAQLPPWFGAGAKLFDDEVAVYLVDIDGSVVGVSKSTGQVTVTSQVFDQELGAAAMDTGFIYAAEYLGRIDRVSKASGARSTIRTVILEDWDGLYGLAVSNTHLFFSTETDIHAVPKKP